MRVLFDQSAPYKLGRYLEGHSVSTAEECGWDCLTNRDVLAVAEKGGFDLFLTADKNIRYQQKLSDRKIALVVLGNSPWQLVRLHIAEIVAAVNAASPGPLSKSKSRFLLRSRLHILDRLTPRTLDGFEN